MALKAQGYSEPATNVRKFEEIDLASVDIDGGSITGADIVPSSDALTAAGAIDPDTGYTAITGPESSTYAVTLAAPSNPGVFKVIEMVATTSTNAVTLALTNVIGGSGSASASFDAANETLTLVSVSGKWVVLDEHGVTLSS